MNDLIKLNFIKWLFFFALAKQMHILCKFTLINLKTYKPTSDVEEIILSAVISISGSGWHLTASGALLIFLYKIYFKREKINSDYKRRGNFETRNL